MPDVSLSTEGVWEELRANIRGFVGRRVRQPADVDDIVQRVFLQVHRALPTLRDADRLHAWIYQTTRRAIADYYRAPSQSVADWPRCGRLRFLARSLRSAPPKSCSRKPPVPETLASMKAQSGWPRKRV